MKNYRSFIILLICCGTVLFSALNAYANNLQVKNITIAGLDEGVMTVQFDISWDNSWMDSTKKLHDAAWVFAKWYSYADGEWKHITMAPNLLPTPTNFSEGIDGDTDGESDEIKILVPDDCKGMFIRRDADIEGETLSRAQVTFEWNYQAAGISDYDAEKVLRLMIGAVEMVYVSEGNFYVGDGDGSSESVNAWHEYNSGVIDNLAVEITADQKQITDDTGARFTVDGDDGIGPAGSVTKPKFPTGYRAFYCMKYELSHGQYRDFLNMLKRTQQNNRVEVDVSQPVATAYFVLGGSADPSCPANRMSLACTPANNAAPYTIRFGCDYNNNGYFDEPDDGAAIPINLRFRDLEAYADWAGLRPMSELEFEKVCRGASVPVKGEYAWGTTEKTEALNIENNGYRTETASESGNGLIRIHRTATYMEYGDELYGPLRCGFGATQTTDRVQSGAACTGAMEMSGNMVEYVVKVNTLIDFAYDVHGDGYLTADGQANVTGWPDNQIQIMIRGGTQYSSKEMNQQVSYRGADSLSYFDQMYNEFGGRCVRTAPIEV